MSASPMLRATALFLCTSLLGGCGWIGDLLSPEDEEDWRVQALKQVSSKIKLEKVWAASAGNAKRTETKIYPLRQGSALYVCDSKGTISSFSVQTGKRLWQKSFHKPVSFCVGGGNKTLMMGMQSGEVVAFTDDSGTELWRTRLRGGAVTALSRQHRGAVLARNAAGYITLLSTKDGKQRWQIKEDLPVLTLRGMSVPLMHGDFGLVGLDDGRLIVLLLASGEIIREIRVGFPLPGTDVDRLLDIDGRSRIDRNVLFISSHQGRTMAVDLEQGELQWAAETNSHIGLDVDDERVYLTATNGKLIALDRYTGAMLWENAAFSVRDMSAPLAAGRYVVVGDDKGFLYWVSARDGTILAKFDAGDPIVSPPLKYRNHVIVLDRDGDVTAIRTIRRRKK